MRSAIAEFQGSGIVKREDALLEAALPMSPPKFGQALMARPVVLIASTTWWAFPARIAMACAARGMQIAALCGRGHPLLKTAATRSHYTYGALAPLRALNNAIRSSGASIVVPCDERARAHLHLLHARTNDPSVRRLIENSLGDPQSFAILEDRTALIGCARDLGIAAPETLRVDTPQALLNAIDRLGLPAVIKVDGTWGGFGVCAVRTLSQAQEKFALLSRRLSFGRAAKRLLVDRDPYHLRPWLEHAAPRLCLQRYQPGRPANSVSACLDGEILGTVSAESLVLQRPHGASSVVRIIDNQQMSKAATKLARHLKLCGVFGLDFLIDEHTGQAHLVEMNARATPLTHLAFGAGSDLIGAIGHIAGIPAMTAMGDPVRVTDRDVIAYFPQAWHASPGSPWLSQGFHDVPWEDPALLKELLKKPRPDRGLLATARLAMRRKAQAGGGVAINRMMDVK
jgi:hypothetical protein